MKNLFLLLICWTMSNQGFCQRVGLNKLFFPLEVVSQNDTPNPVLIRADGNNTGLATIALNANNLTATTNYTLGRNGSNSAILSYDQTINNLTFRVSNQPFMAFRVNAANNFVPVNYFNASPNLAQLEVYGTTKCGADGTVMNSIIKRTITMDIPTISAGQTATLTFILSAVAPLGSVVSISPKANLDPKLVIDYARVSASGVVDVVITNISTTFAQRNAILPTQGLTIFDITNSSYWYFDGESWVNLAIASANP